MKMRAYLVLTTVLFALAAIVHLVRLVYGWHAVIGTTVIPLPVSLIALVICVLLAFWGGNLARRM